MTEEQVVRISKYLSRHLRHSPERIGLKLDNAGWCTVEELLAALHRNNISLTRTGLEQVVADNNKKRFAFSEDGTKIRASQGHSIEVDLELSPITPPDTLYHGTGRDTVAAIQISGIQKMNRHHVHLSADMETARSVGARHGKPAVFAIDARALHASGQAIYRSANGVYLTDSVPVTYLRLL